jgi:aspartate-semialdehyde dehydrogenase
MHLPDDILIECTAVRVPILRAHSESITIETEKPFDPVRAREVLSAAPGVTVVDSPADKIYPMPSMVEKQDNVQVGRIRQSLAFGDHGGTLFISGDQLLK